MCFSGSCKCLTVICLTVTILGLADAQSEKTDRSSMFNFTDLGEWEPPKEMYKDLPYYQAGYDYEGRPVIVLELGHWNLTKYFIDGDKELQDRSWKYMEQLWYRITPEANFYPNISQGYYFINDLDGWNSQQLLIPGMVPLYFRSAYLSGRVYDPSTSVAVVINVHFAAQTMFNLIKPYVGETLGSAEFIGTNKERYIARFLRDIPKDQLPGWYGGAKDFKPAKSFT